ncbi:MAG: glycosyl transferase [Chitinophagaceae bacterium]|nr:MAG: glycosyl transferase [Chitinophagaceae bacterium]
MWHPGLLVLFAVFFIALLLCLGLILTQRWHGWLTLDHDLNGIQKIHKRPVPRIGGIALFIALLSGGVGALIIEEPTAKQILVLLACSLPAFLAGLIEDLTKRVGVRTRLYASFISALMAVWLLNASLSKLDTPGLDFLMTYSTLSVLFTCFAVGGLTNAINIIDGINGLASGSVILMLSGLGALAWFHHDILVIELCLLGAVALTGFLFLNFPNGKIFLGDGGAYLAGFWLAECAVLLLVRNESVSTWAVLLVCFYPVCETIFSMYRRHVIEKVKTGRPDGAHLHHLLMQRVKVHNLTSQHVWVLHGLSSAVIWGLIAFFQLFVIATIANPPALIAGTVVFAAVYYWIYRTLALKKEAHEDSLQIAKF